MLKMKFVKKIGNREYEFEVEGKTLYDVITDSQKLSFGDVEACGACGSKNLILSTHVAKDKYKYTEVKCLDCKAALNFGFKTDDPEVCYLKKVDGIYDWRTFVSKSN